MTDVRQIAHVSAYVDGATATEDQRTIAHVSAYVEGQVATAGRREIAHVSAYVCQVTPPPSALITYGVSFVDEDGNSTTVVGTPMAGDRAVWDTDNYATLHAKDIADNLPRYHMPSDDRSIYDVPYWTGSKWAAIATMVYGGIYGYESNTTITIASSGSANKVQVTAFTANEPFNNISPDHTNDHVTIIKSGDYSIKVSITCESAAGVGFVVGFGVYINNGATLQENLYARRTLAGGGGDIGSITISGIATLSANDTVELWCWNEDNTTDVVVDDVTMSLRLIKGT